MNRSVNIEKVSNIAQYNGIILDVEPDTNICKITDDEHNKGVLNKVIDEIREEYKGNKEMYNAMREYSNEQLIQIILHAYNTRNMKLASESELEEAENE